MALDRYPSGQLKKPSGVGAPRKAHGEQLEPKPAGYTAAAPMGLVSVGTVEEAKKKVGGSVNFTEPPKTIRELRRSKTVTSAVPKPKVIKKPKVKKPEPKVECEGLACLFSFLQ